MLSSLVLVLAAAASTASAAAVEKRQSSSSSSSVSYPGYFQTTPQLFAGPTTTAKAAPFLAQTNPAPFGQETASFVANAPLQTNIPISGNTNKSSIFQLVGQLSSYFSNPTDKMPYPREIPTYSNCGPWGFGVDEYPLPPGANISLVNVLHRHGARYPTGDSGVVKFGSKLHNITANGTAKWSGDLAFLNKWQYTLGAEILVARGRQEMFDSGVLHYYNYGALYNTSTKIIARTTTQDRMLKSAEYFMAGFFGLQWTKNATLEPILEGSGYNNSLAGYFQCPNNNNYRSGGGTNASVVWETIYLKDATARFKSMAGGYNWTTADSYNLQTLCPYETVAYGYSEICDVFTYEEWKGFEYSIDLSFAGSVGFSSPTGRAVGIGYVEELYARLQGHLYNLPKGSTQVNATLDEMKLTFPLNQTLYFDFSHDTNIWSIMTAMGLTQFNQTLPETGPPANQIPIVSHITPFGARLVIEVIKTPHPVLANRPAINSATMSHYYNMSGGPTTYFHLMSNQRTIPWHSSYASCPKRADGWCEESTVFAVWAGLLNTARYEYSCFTNYSTVPYGGITNGAPITKRDAQPLDLRSYVGSGLSMFTSGDRFME